MAYWRHMALRNRSESKFPEVMACGLTGPIHYLNQYWRGKNCTSASVRVQFFQRKIERINRPTRMATWMAFIPGWGGMNLNSQDIKPQFVVEIYFWDHSHISHITRGQWVKNKYITASLLWRRNGHGGVSNHQPHHCLLNRLFGCRSKKTSKLRVTGLCAGNSLGTGQFPAQMASNGENISIWWRHRALSLAVCLKTQCHCAL